MKGLDALRLEVLDTFRGIITDAVCERDRSACGTVCTVDGYIDLFATKEGDVDAVVVHDGNRAKRSPNLEAYLEGIMREVSWGEIEKEVEADNAETFEQEYARLGESLFAPELRWHRL